MRGYCASRKYGSTHKSCSARHQANPQETHETPSKEFDIISNDGSARGKNNLSLEPTSPTPGALRRQRIKKPKTYSFKISENPNLVFYRFAQCGTFVR
jgi:hypothetical protein